MKKIIFMLNFVAVFVAGAVEFKTDDYTLGSGDTIRVLVYDEPDLTVEMTIGDNGKINFPFLGDVLIKGKTSQQVQSYIADGLRGDYLINPSVLVSISRYRPFYIHGEVNKPGAYAFQPGLNVDQAIALAGGLTERASEEKIYIKEDVNGKAVTKKVSLISNVSPGETITIKQSFF